MRRRLKKMFMAWVMLIALVISTFIAVPPLETKAATPTMTDAQKEIIRQEVRNWMLKCDIDAELTFSIDNVVYTDFLKIFNEEDKKLQKENIDYAWFRIGNGSISINWDLYRYGPNNVYVEKIVWIYADEDFQNRYKKVLQVKNEILAGIEPGMSDLDKILYLNEWYLDNTQYSSDEYEGLKHSNPSRLLVYGNGACMSFAGSVHLLLDELGMENILISSSNHQWNMVKYQGEWYQLDMSRNVRNQWYNNLMMSDAKSRTNHQEWSYYINGKKQVLPACSTKFDNWFAYSVYNTMRYCDGYWYYVKGKSICRAKADGSDMSTVKSCSGTVVIKGIENGVLTYTNNGAQCTMKLRSDSGSTGSGDSGNSGNTGSGNSGSTGSGNSGSTGSGNSGSTGSGNSGSTGSGNSGSTGNGDSGNSGSGDNGNSGSGDNGNSGSTGSGDSGNNGSTGNGNSGSSNSGSTGSGNSGSTGSGNSGSTGSGNSGSTGSGNSGSTGSGNSGSTGSTGNSGNQGTIENGNQNTGTTNPTENTVPNVNVSYRTHVQSFGWQNVVSNGTMSGTSGKAKRLEAIEISVAGNKNLGIRYTTHCQSYGWLPWSANGEMNGTEGEAKRLEAIKIQLTGSDADKYDVYYRVHAQSYGWLGWAKNGAPAGTAGYAKRLEGIQIIVVKKGSSINQTYGNIVSKRNEAYVAVSGKSPVVGAAATDNKNPMIQGESATNVAYKTHVQSYGWQGWKYNGAMSGTQGAAKRLEGICIKLTNKQYTGGIAYTTHVQSYGWQGNINNPSTWRHDGQMAGTSGEAKRLEAICITLTGEMANHYDVYYRVHAQSYGWLGWAKNGEASGTAGYGKRLEGIQVVLVPKNSGAPANNYGGQTSKTSQAYISKTGK